MPFKFLPLRPEQWSIFGVKFLSDSEKEKIKYKKMKIQILLAILLSLFVAITFADSLPQDDIVDPNYEDSTDDGTDYGCDYGDYGDYESMAEGYTSSEPESSPSSSMYKP